MRQWKNFPPFSVTLVDQIDFLFLLRKPSEGGLGPRGPVRMTWRSDPHSYEISPYFVIISFEILSMMCQEQIEAKNGKSFSLVFLPPLPSHLSPNMELCALSLLGLCDKMALSDRIATETWCISAMLTEEESAKVTSNGLCSNHARHPERLRPFFEAPPSKRSKSDPPDTSTPPRISPQNTGPAPITPPNSGGEKLCNGINNPDLEVFISHRHGFVIIDYEGYLWGEKQRGWTTYKARMCPGVVVSKKKNGATSATASTRQC